MGNLGENLAVEGDIVFLQHGNKFGVRETVLFQYGGRTHVPQSSEITFLIAAMSESVFAGVEQGFIGLTLFLGSAEAVALGLAQKIAPPLQCVYAFFDSGHLFDIYQKTGPLFIGHMEFHVLIFSGLIAPPFFVVEVVLARLPGQKLAGLGYLNPFQIGFVGFHF